MGTCNYSSVKKSIIIGISFVWVWFFFSVIQFSEIYNQNRFVSDRHDGIGNNWELSPLQKRVFDLYMSEVYKLIIHWFTLTQNEPKNPLINKHLYRFDINSKLCKATQPGILIVIHSDPENFGKRMVIRKTWCSRKYLLATSILCVFMLGERYNSVLQGEINSESKLHGDIVQGNFYDSYKNLTYKHVMALHWIMSQCNDVRTVVKVDDDVFIDIYKLANFSITIGHINNHLYCSVFKYAHPRRNGGKWLTSQDEYPFDYFPDYCAGMVYIMSLEVAVKLSKASENTSFYWIDDVYVTGILALKSGVGLRQFSSGHGTVQAVYLEDETQVSVTYSMFYHDFKDWEHLWYKIMAEFKSQGNVGK